MPSKQCAQQRKYSVTAYRCVQRRRQRSQQRYSREWLYGLSQDEYDILLKAQKRHCALCRKVRHSAAVPLRVDHDHATGNVRGLLCHPCNVGLGMFGDTVKGLEAAIRYLVSVSC